MLHNWKVVAVGAGLAALLASPASVTLANGKEAPMLAEMVASGALPSLKERLPNRPLVLTPLDSVGVYGGTWRTGARASAENWNLRTVGYDMIVNWAPDWSDVVPNIIESYAVNDDATEYVFQLREGMRWSDGAPFTADDLVYADAVMAHPDLPGYPTWMLTAEGPGKIEKMDDLTARVTFPAPNARFLEGMAQVTSLLGGDYLTRFPRHYMAQFHIDNGGPDLDRAMREAGVSTWHELFTLRSETYFNPDKPTLNAWRVITPFGDGSRMVMERNPFYWKTDTEGNQLPYFDRVVFEVAQDMQVLLLKTIAGEIDMIAARINTTENRSVLYDNQDRGNYRLFELLSAESNFADFAFNMTHTDPTLRAIFNERRFREALSHGIDRQAIIDLVYIGQAIPVQTAVRADYPPLYNERLATQHLEYDVDLANRLLDEAGFAERNAAGLRLGPDGSPIRFQIIVSADKPANADVAELVAGYWSALGLDVRTDVVERSLQRTRTAANQHDVAVNDFSSGSRDAILQPSNWIPVHHSSHYGVPWYDWWRGAAAGEEPPASVRRQLDLWGMMGQEPDAEKRFDMMREILDIAAENFFSIGVGAEGSGYGVISNRMRNVPEPMIGSYWFATPGPNNPPTWYYAN
ncbi:ABC transporter substrate-binding protein [Rubrimonas sp.]|uniref:ABC transporter substrate-binding protein n=1 Tax=Rubrimonas sp. TaxID=2036015 RepID=UPI002FDCDEE8